MLTVNKLKQFINSQSEIWLNQSILIITRFLCVFLNLLRLTPYWAGAFPERVNDSNATFAQRSRRQYNIENVSVHDANAASEL